MGENDLIKMLEPKAADTSMRSKKTHWPQLIIFFNGLILTIAATTIFFGYIQQSIEHKTRETLSEFIQHVNLELEYAYSIFKLETIARSKTNNNLLSLYHIERNTTGQWVTKSVYRERSIQKDAIHQAIKDINKNDLQKMFALNGQLYFVHTPKENTAFIGLLNQEKLKTIIENSKYTSIEEIHFFSGESHIAIFSYERKINTPKNNILYFNEQAYILDQTIEVQSELHAQKLFFFSDKIPLIVFLFGTIMTILGTLFVRNNHKQAEQMQLMNEVLEDKNQSLEYKIEEAQSISKALRDSEEEYKAVVNSVPDILFELDLNGQIVFLNKSWDRITGIPSEETYGDSIFKHINSSDIDTVQKAFFDFTKTKKHTKLPAKIKLHTGEYHTVDIAFSILRKDSDNIPHVIGTITDIEDKRRTERALDEAEKRSRKIIENAAGGIYQIAPDGTIMAANPSFIHILGYKHQEDITKTEFNIRDIYTNTDDRKRYETEINRNGQIRNYETQLRHTSGRIIWINENARAVKDDNGTLLYYEGSIEDITQRKEAELALIEAKLNSDLASRAKSEFLANMSHELRTPLNSIIGFSEIIKGEALGEITQKPYVDYAKDIHTSGTRLLSVINEILGISKIEAGERQLNESIVNLEHVSQTCVDLMANKIENRHLHINNLIDESTPHIVAEELAFKQILMNLLSNAIKFTPENGTITLSSDYNGRDLRLSITDTGVGIDEVDIPKALSPFGQVDNSLARSNSGTGLGLTLVESLIRLHGGSLEMISQKGYGTTVTLIIPEKRVATKKEKQAENSDKITKLSDYK